MTVHANLEDNVKTPLAESYSQRSNPEFEAIMALRTVEKEGAFLLPHIKSGMRVLDVGCGPGSITIGFAKLVAPGEVLGIDLQPSQVAKAQALSVSRGIENVHFETADIYKLPFPDNSFDSVFANSVLNHLRKPIEALKEIRRVLRPDGIVGIRDLDWGGRIHAPITPLLEEWYKLTVKVRQQNGGNPFLGRHQRRLLIEAGFVHPVASVSTWASGTAEETRLCSIFLKAQLKGLAATALTEGWIDQATIEKVAAEFDEWALRPDALYVDTYCEALGWIS